MLLQSEGAKFSLGSINDGIIFGIHIFILGPLTMFKTSKLAGERFSGDADKVMGVAFAIIGLGLISGSLYAVICGLKFL